MHLFNAEISVVYNCWCLSFWYQQVNTKYGTDLGHFIVVLDKDFFFFTIPVFNVLQN